MDASFRQPTIRFDEASETVGDYFFRRLLQNWIFGKLMKIKEVGCRLGLDPGLNFSGPGPSGSVWALAFIPVPLSYFICHKIGSQNLPLGKFHAGGKTCLGIRLMRSKPSFKPGPTGSSLRSIQLYKS